MLSLANLTTHLATLAHFVIAQAPASATAPAAAAAATTQQSRPWYAAIFDSGMFLPIALLVLLYIFIFSSKRKQEKKKRDLLGQIKRGDRVQTIGGILGKVVEADDAKVLLKVDESSNTKIWFSRSAIHRVLDEEKSDKAETK